MKLSDYVLKFVADLGIRKVPIIGAGAVNLNQSLGVFAPPSRVKPFG